MDNDTTEKMDAEAVNARSDAILADLAERRQDRIDAEVAAGRRQTVLEAIRDNPGATQAEIARITGVHQATVSRYARTISANYARTISDSPISGGPDG